MNAHDAQRLRNLIGNLVRTAQLLTAMRHSSTRPTRGYEAEKRRLEGRIDKLISEATDHG